MTPQAARAVDCSALGLIWDDACPAYFCTPDGAAIFGRAGVDGIHFCQVPANGETVFAVSPMNEPGAYVHPLAADFDGFLRLLLACGDTAAMEQAWAWSREQFESFLRENQPDAAQQAALAALAAATGLSPIEDPYGYLRTVQAPSAPGGETQAPAPEGTAAWQVFFDGWFGSRHGHGRAGEEIPLHRQFRWGDETWQVPAVYACGKGLVVDFCVAVDPDRIRAFLEQWTPLLESSAPLTAEQHLRLEVENPTNLAFHATLTLNGRKLRACHGMGLSWIPASCRPADYENAEEAAALLSHYGLDPACGWAFHRSCYLWATARKPQIRQLLLHMERDPVTLPGPHLHNPAAGDEITFCHPVTGVQHRLTVRSCAPEICEATAAPFLIPSHYTAMTYALEPDLPDRAIQVLDCLENDAPRPKPGACPPSNLTDGAASIGIIGGADGPTAIFLSQDTPPAGLHAAHSALHHEPVQAVEWRIQFRETLQAGLTVSLLPD